ncbi:MAG: tRNA (uridine(34)/cytosine(34)/5-carboxymethylaminomethyluridine(34)-2'-O)-methyltransferase TrmL [Pseudomonadales bacterium]|nr:tRNA (uridine(34)/cytosine(34)/5-carboxymethylaminomethyluridine(34)-2'-O)-methyltransferase TrmL [Pseudomonadales bacterium]MBL6814079.1 tRNA (uridine(34)/cytosine(34)/5-carboxymethylaminomethyluridine(34)-2'-O)-methyltransferase TrmL [Pseudomonadales bacterium]
MHIVLYQPEIPPNTGNIIRICANTGASLHLIRPLGFDWDDKRMRRAGLDYHDFTRVTLHDSLAACEQQLHTNRWFAMTTKGSRNFAEVAFNAQDVLLFGPETRGLPDEVLARWPGDRKLRIPMQASSRSINLANSVAITLYEAWRQRGYDGIL